MIVYLLTNRITGKKYVGKTVRTLSARWWQHVYGSRQEGKTPLQRTLRKYGSDAFDRTVLSVATNDQVLNDVERFWIRELKTYAPGGYNLTAGGEGCVSFKQYPEVVRKLSALHRGRKRSKETCDRISAAARGRKLSAESLERTATLGRSNRGRKHTEAERIRMSLAGGLRWYKAQPKQGKIVDECPDLSSGEADVWLSLYLRARTGPTDAVTGNSNCVAGIRFARGQSLRG